MKFTTSNIILLVYAFVFGIFIGNALIKAHYLQAVIFIVMYIIGLGAINYIIWKHEDIKKKELEKKDEQPRQ